MQTKTKRKMAAIVLPFALLIAACGSDNKDDSSSKSSDTTAASSETTAATSDTTASDAGSPEGPGCAAVPESGKGSFDGMAQDPVATAASNNPALSTLVSAVTKADLVDTLNSGDAFTVFAPVNDAFAKIPEDTLNSVLEDKDTLTSILTYHVIPERIEPSDLSGSYTTVQGEKLTVSGDGPEFSINDGEATVVCAGIQTANATVYLIDGVLMPPSN